MLKESKQQKLRLGVGRVDITPKVGVQLAGHIGVKRPMNEVHDRIYATATIFDDGTTRLCLIAANLLASTNFWSDKLRKQAGDILGIPPEQLMFHVPQNHATPSLGHHFTFENESSPHMDKWPWLLGGDEEYNPWCVEQICKAVQLALGDLTPVTLEAGRGFDGRVAFNRRFILRDGTAVSRIGKCTHDKILACEGPIDPEVSVWRFADAAGKAKALFLHHSCHPCHGFGQRYVIAGWTGQWETDMMTATDDKLTAITLNGCCGNLLHVDYLLPDPMNDYHPQNDYQKMSSILTETARQTLENGMNTVTNLPLKSITRTLHIPWRMLTDEELAEAEEKLKKFPEPEWISDDKSRVSWDWVYAVGRIDLAAMQRKYRYAPYEIQIFRIGDAAIVGLKGEPFVEGQLEIKKRSPAPFTTVAHFCNGYAGYLPTLKAFEGGGYETRTGKQSKHCKEALEMVTQTTIAMLYELFSE